MIGLILFCRGNIRELLKLFEIRIQANLVKIIIQLQLLPQRLELRFPYNLHNIALY